MKALDDDEGLDPKKLFNKKEYNTLIIGRDGFSLHQNNIADLLEELTEKKITRSRSEEIFIELKKIDATDLLVDTIKKTENIRQKGILTAACWESGLDFTKHFLFFVNLAFSEDLQLSLEAITVLEYCDGKPDEAILKKAIEIAENTKSQHIDLTSQLLEHLHERLGD